MPVSAMPVITVTLDKVAGARACASSDQRAFSAADQCAADGSDAATDKRSPGSTVVMPAVATLRGGAHASKCPEQ